MIYLSRKLITVVLLLELILLLFCKKEQRDVLDESTSRIKYHYLPSKLSPKYSHKRQLEVERLLQIYLHSLAKFVLVKLRLV